MTTTEQTESEANYSYWYSEDFITSRDTCIFMLKNPTIDFGFVIPVCLAALCGVIGNGSLILVGVLNKNLRSSGPNVLLLQLAFAGLIYIVLKVPYAIDTEVSNGCWRYGLYGCKIFSFSFMFSRGLMVWTLAASSINLCVSLIKGSVRLIPSSKSGIRAASRTLVVTWTWCFMISLPSFFLAQLYIDDYHCTSVPITFNEDGTIASYTPLKICFLLWTIFQYILPLIIIGCAYGIIAYKLVKSTTSFSESQPRMNQFFEERKRLVRIFYFITGLFATCWFPFYLYHLMAIGDLAAKQLKKPAMVAAILFPCIYPWITYLMSAPYRQGVKCVFRGHGYHRVSRQTETYGHTMHSINNRSSV